MASLLWNKAQQHGLALPLRLITQSSTPRTMRAATLLDHPLSAKTTAAAAFSSAASGKKNASPSYQVYGETAALTLKMIPPSFKQLGASTIVLDSNKRGRLLLEFAPRKTGPESGRYAWDRSMKFAITAEEAGMLLARLHTMEGIDMSRQLSSDAAAPSKVLRVQEFPDGSALFLVDYYLDGIGGQHPPSDQESRGPIEVYLTVGEHAVIKSILEYSIPRLVGWSTMMDMTMENALTRQSAPVPNPHNYAGRANDVPF